MSQQVTISCPRCEGEVTMSVYDDHFGADADGNRGEWREEFEFIDGRCDCDWNDAEWRQAEAAASEERGRVYEEMFSEPELEEAGWPFK